MEFSAFSNSTYERRTEAFDVEERLVKPARKCRATHPSQL
jgi:hypothetical protein